MRATVQAVLMATSLSNISVCEKMRKKGEGVFCRMQNVESLQKMTCGTFLKLALITSQHTAATVFMALCLGLPEETLTHTPS